ncbi:MAG: AraC family transcriptional regulator [Pseudomonadota bacterium]
MNKRLDNHPTLHGVVLFSAPAGMHVHDDHSHDGYSIIVVTGGSKAFRNSGQTAIVSTDEIAISNPGQVHGCGPATDEPWSHKTWYVSQDLAMQLMGSDEAPSLQSPMIRDKSIAAALNDAHDGVYDDSADPDAEMIANEALVELFHTYSMVSSGDDPQAVDRPESRTAACIAYMADHLAQGLALRDLASHVGVSRNQIIRDFKRVHQTTPGRYLRLLRLQRARHAMEQGETLSDVAVAAGYADQSHFTKQFRQAFGVTPKRFQKLLTPSSPL